MCCQREVGPTAFHSSTMRLFLLGGTFGSDFLCTRWLSPKGPKAPGIIRIPDVLATVDLGWCDPTLLLPSMYSAVGLNSEMLVGMLLRYLLVFIFNFDPPNEHYPVKIFSVYVVKNLAVRRVCSRTILVNIWDHLIPRPQSSKGSPFLTHWTCSGSNYTLSILQNNSFHVFNSRMYFDIGGKSVFTLMWSRLETLIKAGLPYFPAVLIKSTNYFHVSISRSSFDA